MEKKSELLQKMKDLSLKIMTSETKRQAYALGLKEEYISPTAIREMKKEFAELSRQHKKLFFKQI